MKRSFGMRRLVSAFVSRRLADGLGRSLHHPRLIAVKWQTLLLCLIAGPSCAQTISIPFKKPENFPVSFHLVLPKTGSTVVSHTQQEGFDTITASLDDDRGGGFTVEAVDPNGKRVWHHDFGYNASAAPGCSAGVSFHPMYNAVIVTYQGYKSDHDHKLLFVSKIPSGHQMAEYPAEAPEIFQVLKKQSGYSPKHKYWIYPLRFVDSHIQFECIPLALPERGSVHPLDQEVQWFEVTTSIDQNFKITPASVKPSH